MIDHIRIRNFAIIEETEVDFSAGLSVLTGETGSGKSIVIEAISLALGARADTSYVRRGADKAVIQLVADDRIITREISSAGKSLCRIDGQIVPLRELQEVCRSLVDIHGQYDNQSLLDADQHLAIVDQYQKDKTQPILAAYQEAYGAFSDAKAALRELTSRASENARKLDFYRFELDEIDKADLRPGEEAELEERLALLQNSEKIFAGTESAHQALAGDHGTLTSLGSALSSLQQVSSYTAELSAIATAVEDAYYALEDAASNLRQVSEAITFAPEELDAAIARADRIDGLKKKYGPTIQDILAYRDRIATELNQIENYDQELTRLTAAMEETQQRLQAQAELLTEARRLSAGRLSAAIEAELHDLSFGDARLVIAIEPLDSPSEWGCDRAEIQIATNPGEGLKPLAKTASGGEISRIMLAIKSITGKYDQMPTMIFDEIDAGISGRTASVVGRKLRQIAAHHQVICITHLPQIACQGDTGYRIAKTTDGERTYTTVDKLTEEERVDEVARLLGGETITEAARQNARDLIAAARQ